jgi:hypothetical protein
MALMLDWHRESATTDWRFKVMLLSDFYFIVL